MLMLLAVHQGRYVSKFFLPQDLVTTPAPVRVHLTLYSLMPKHYSPLFVMISALLQ